MARNTDTIDYRQDYYWGLAGIYSRRNMRTAIKIGDLNNEAGLILDFGCGVGHLKKRLADKNIIGYDIIPELSDIDDYRKLKPNKIVLLSVLEHLHLGEIDKLLNEFLMMNPEAELIILLPTENFISKIAMCLAGQSNAHDDHVSKYKDINKIIEKYYYPQKRVYNFLGMAQITKYANKKKEANATSLPCAVCDAEASMEAEIDDIKLHRCSICNHCFTDANSLNYFEDYNPQYYEKNWSRNPNYKLFNFISRYINKVCPSGSVLDIGCGHGDFLAYIQKLNPKLSLTGIDLSQLPEITGINFIRGDFMATEFNQTYDAIVSLAVIEHIADVKNFVKKLYQLCKPNGYVFIMTLDDQSFLYKTARVLKYIGLRQPFKRLYSRHHLNHFNVFSLKHLLVNQGFSLAKEFHHNIPIKSVDTGFDSVVADFCARVGLLVIFALGKLTKKTYLQTAVCRR